jgi:hypothetical protein
MTLELFALGFVAVAALIPWLAYVVRTARQRHRAAEQWKRILDK